MSKGLRKTLNHRPTRIRRKLIILGTEGNNKTETLYFTELEKKQNKYHIIFTNSNNTDPNSVITSVFKEAQKQEIKIKNGDISAVIFDIDLDINKIKTIQKIINLAKKKNVEIYSSNPCFELWYLLHFTYSTKPYNSNIEVINKLKKYIPDYEKNKCNFNILYPLTSKAITNSKLIQLKQKEINYNNNYLINNPNTDVYKLVEKLISKNKRDK